MTSSPEVLVKPEYNISCSLNISIFISSHQNSAFVYIFMGVANGLFSITALVVVVGPSMLYKSSKSLFYSLAISDLVIGLVGQPLYSVYLLAIAWDNARLFCVEGLPHTIITTCFSTVSLWTLTVIALGRYLAMRLRFRYCSVVKVHRIAVVLVTGWLFIALRTASRTLGIKLRQIIGTLVLPICLMLSSYFYIRTYFTLRQHKLKTQGRSSFNHGALSQITRQHVSRFLLVLNFLSSVCVRLGRWLQYHGLTI